MTSTIVTRTRRPPGLVLSRRLPAPREVVFRALSEPEHLIKWWAPASCPVVECTVDFRPGGLWHYRLRLPDGSEAWTRSVYQEIVPPERISYLENSSDASGSITRDRPGASCVITLAPAGVETVLTVTLSYQTPADRQRALGNGVERGFAAALEQLDRLLRPVH